jgi:hypothetical protein
LEPTCQFYTALQKNWAEGIRQAFTRLPRFEWESNWEHLPQPVDDVGDIFCADANGVLEEVPPPQSS